MTEGPGKRSSLTGRIELLLWTAGALCAAFCAMSGARALAARRQAAMFGRKSSSASELQETVPVVQRVAVGSASASTVIGRLQIPDIALSVPMMAGYDPDSLLRGVGHIQGTAMPGGLGTMGLAGHRDTYFRPLRRIAAKMEIQVVDQIGTYHYEVDSTEVVTPEQVEVLEIRQRPELTLITCYPFDFVGAAPKRFIVHAHLLSAAPDGP